MMGYALTLSLYFPDIDIQSYSDLQQILLETVFLYHVYTISAWRSKRNESVRMDSQVCISYCDLYYSYTRMLKPVIYSQSTWFQMHTVQYIMTRSRQKLFRTMHVVYSC